MTTMQQTDATIAPHTAVTFARRQRGITHWIEGEYPVDARPDPMLAAFENAGWKVTPMGTPYAPMDLDSTKPLGERATFRDYQVQDFTMTKPGTGLFTEWTAEEKTQNMREARAIFRRYGFTRVPTWTKTLADML